MPEVNEAQKQWFEMRVQAIRQNVSAFDVLRYNGVEIKQSADDQEEQISCPFHGEDKKPSCRVYPAEGPDDPSHAWCFVCQEPRWDAIGLWQKFNGGRENCSFSEALSGIEKHFGLKAPSAPNAKEYYAQLAKEEKEREEKVEVDAFKRIYKTAENRLLSCRKAYRTVGDLQGYLAAGSALDKILYRVSKTLWTPARGVKSLEALLDKIADKVAEAPEGLTIEQMRERDRRRGIVS